MDTACTEELYEQAKTWLEEGQASDTLEDYGYLIKDPDGVIDSLLQTFQDAYGTVQERRPARLYTKYEDIHDGDPSLRRQSYGHALAALDDMDLIEHDTTRGRARWRLEDTDPEKLKAVKEAAHDPDIQQLYA